MLRIGIGSTNPVKLMAVENAVRFVWKQRNEQHAVTFLPVEVESGVSAQPFTDEETRTGARNRAEAIMQQVQKCNLAFGLEGGVFEEADGELWSTVWVCVRDRQGRERCVNGMRFQLPSEIQVGLRTGKELGTVMDELTKRTNMKHSEGMIGILTGGVLPRSKEYENLVRLAFALYWEEVS
jgi:inosine/xanthosine triphosphatase